ncbi:hypothetical protein [Naasia lichenicola]|uniref:Uncharacterized protein n=1 Tax=Naasia lichenicola TaxID=2565933 RepID=A0A4S4FI23_9MICO|nr:hypothetical protein [Naasia lichenicola]THG29899.1 hypothetical protein E6C64_14730 [Naasia lichenicola]
MDAVEGFQRVVDRLHEWFCELDRHLVETVLRDETLEYQSRLRMGIYGPAAEHGAFARLQELRDHADAALLLDVEAA